MSRDIFIPDIHADLDAFRDTLVHAKLATWKHGELILDGDDVNSVTFTGDFIDRGPHNLPTLELLIEVLQHFREKATALIGNHEAAALQAFAHPNQAKWMAVWMESLPLLRETAEHERMSTLSHAVRDAHPLADNKLDPDDPDTHQYLAAWEKIITEHPEWQTTDFPEAFGRTRDLFLGRFLPLFQQLQVARRIENILAVHAGWNRKADLIGIDRLNTIFRTAVANLNIGAFIDFDWQQRTGKLHTPLSELLCMMKSLPPSEQPLVEESVVRSLHANDIRVLVHGHAAIGPRLRQPGVQECNSMYGLVADMNGDIVMTRHHKDHTGSTWGFLEYDRESGKFTAVNPKTGPLHFGTLIDGEYTFPPEG